MNFPDSCSNAAISLDDCHGPPITSPPVHRFTEELSVNRTAYLLLLPSVCVFAVLVIVPLAGTIAGAFSQADAVGRIGRLGTLQNFVDLWPDPRLLRIVLQTAVFVLISVAVTVVASFPLARFSTRDFRV